MGMFSDKKKVALISLSFLGFLVAGVFSMNQIDGSLFSGEIAHADDPGATSPLPEGSSSSNPSSDGGGAGGCCSGSGGCAGDGDAGTGSGGGGDGGGGS